jgi:branched-chain amino acid aminotransferase
LPFDMTFGAFEQACHSIIRAVLEPGKDLWLRPTVLPVEGNWGVGTVCDLAITAYTQAMKRPDPIDVGVSTWQRPSDAAQPARIKSAANYTVGRTARMEGRRLGFGEMILLNHWGRVAEATGSAVVIVRDGIVVTPPASEGCLESITVDIIERICTQLAIRFQRRPLDRSELAIVDEMCVAGTLSELAPAKRIEFRELPAPGPVLADIADVFWKAVRQQVSIPGVELSPVPV